MNIILDININMEKAWEGASLIKTVNAYFTHVSN